MLITSIKHIYQCLLRRCLFLKRKKKKERATVRACGQINGKTKDTIKVSKIAGEEEVMTQVFKLEKVQKATEGKTIKKKIFVPGRIVNLVLSK